MSLVSSDPGDRSSSATSHPDLSPRTRVCLHVYAFEGIPSKDFTLLQDFGRETHYGCESVRLLLYLRFFRPPSGLSVLR